MTTEGKRNNNKSMVKRKTPYRIQQNPCIPSLNTQRYDLLFIHNKNRLKRQHTQSRERGKKEKPTDFFAIFCATNIR